MTTIDDFARLLDAATDGPWEISACNVVHDWGNRLAVKDGAPVDLLFHASDRAFQSDADLIVFARNHGPALVSFMRDAVEALGFYEADENYERETAPCAVRGDIKYFDTVISSEGGGRARAVLSKHKEVIGERD